jgi:hypothetical protein
MIKIARALFACTLFVSVVCLSAAFIALDIEAINPANWDMIGRFFLVAFTAFVATMAYLYPSHR